MTVDLHSPPSRFAVFESPHEPPVGWGLAVPGRVHVHSVEGGICGRLPSVAALSLLFGETCEIVWVDPEPLDVHGEE